MTELTWEGKYDKDGRKVAPLRIALPFQTVETVNESGQQRQASLDLFSRGRDGEWRNRLIWGDKKYVLPALLQEFGGRVDLIYADPPFATGSDFSFTTGIPDSDEKLTKMPSAIEQKAYRDTWGRGLDSYLDWLFQASLILHALLSETGALYLHLDWRVVHYVKAMLDEIFGYDNFISNIIWKRITTGRKATANKWLAVDDILLVYSKGRHRIEPQYVPYSEQFKKRFVHADARGPYYWGDIGTYSQQRLKSLEAEGRIRYPENPRANPRVKMYLNEGKGTIIDNIWTDIPPVNSQALEDTGYPTQKPVALLDRILRASSKEGDLILDCFAGSGTTAVAAEQLGRRWIVCDIGRFAVHTTRKRLLSISNVTPFVMQNLGKYERQYWQTTEFGKEAQIRTDAYRRFILDLFKAQPIEGYAWLHGIRSGRMVHVGTVDAPVTAGDVKQIASELGRAVGTGANAPSTRSVDVLGWDFAFELNELARQTADRAGIGVHFWRIPREVLDKRAAEQGDVRFFELAALEVGLTMKRRDITLRLTDFMIPTEDVPEDVQQAITDWSQWIDYWAVDWDNKGDAFHNEWQTYRTPQEPTLQKSAGHEYEAAGTYQVVVKVIDILGNDTTKTVKVEVA